MTLFSTLQNRMWRKSIKLSGTLSDCCRIEEQRMLKDLAEALDVAFDGVLC